VSIKTALSCLAVCAKTNPDIIEIRASKKNIFFTMNTPLSEKDRSYRQKGRKDFT
jgi:hypothetical protein